jgi:hypothetical protein
MRTSVDNVIDCVANDLLMIGIRPLTMFGVVWTRVDNGVENPYVRTSVDNLFVMIRPPAMATDTIRGVLNVAVDIGYAVTLAIRVLGPVTVALTVLGVLIVDNAVDNYGTTDVLTIGMTRQCDRALRGQYRKGADLRLCVAADLRGTHYRFCDSASGAHHVVGLAGMSKVGAKL